MTATFRIIPDRPNTTAGVVPFNAQLLKWVGNKQRFAREIISYFPPTFGKYFEPFLGSGGVLATLAPRSAIASDAFEHLIRIFSTLQNNPEGLLGWYRERYDRYMAGSKRDVYEEIKASYNANPNPADLLFISQSCYRGLVRFSQDGYLSTPIGPHQPIAPESFGHGVAEWHKRTYDTAFAILDFEEAMAIAKPGDLIYCDPPYADSQKILYGAQGFSLPRLFDVIAECKRRGVYIVLSIDGTKKSGDKICDVLIPAGLFEREVMVHVGSSMLRRLQMDGKTLDGEKVRDRLLLTY